MLLNNSSYTKQPVMSNTSYKPRIQRTSQKFVNLASRETLPLYWLGNPAFSFTVSIQVFSMKLSGFLWAVLRRPAHPFRVQSGNPRFEKFVVVFAIADRRGIVRNEHHAL